PGRRKPVCRSPICPASARCRLAKITMPRPCADGVAPRRTEAGEGIRAGRCGKKAPVGQNQQEERPKSRKRWSAGARSMPIMDSKDGGEGGNLLKRQGVGVWGIGTSVSFGPRVGGDRAGVVCGWDCSVCAWVQRGGSLRRIDRARDRPSEFGRL